MRATIIAMVALPSGDMVSDCAIVVGTVVVGGGSFDTMPIAFASPAIITALPPDVVWLLVCITWRIELHEPMPGLFCAGM